MSAESRSLGRRLRDDRWGDLSSCDSPYSLLPLRLRARRPLGQRLAHDVGLQRDDAQVGLGGGVGLLAALLPVAQRTDGDMEAGGELFLAELEAAADRPYLRHERHTARRDVLF